MYHRIEFCSAFTADLEISRKQRLERLRIRQGMQVYAYLQPYVVKSAAGPVEVADVCFEDGTVT